VTPVSLDALRKKADKAREDLAAAEQQAAQDEADRAARRRDAQTQVWADVARGYDPRARRREVVDARDELHRALVDTDLGRALTGYMAAIVREQRYAEQGRSAQQQSGVDLGFATGNAARDVAPRNAEGKPLHGYVETWATEMLARAAATVAQDTARAEREAFEQRLKDAGDAAADG
jgi:hypothetical protein